MSPAETWKTSTRELDPVERALEEVSEQLSESTDALSRAEYREVLASLLVELGDRLAESDEA